MTHLSIKILGNSTFFFLLLTMPMIVEGFNPFEGPTPVGVFIQTNPWAPVIGSNSPRFALYEDATVIFLKNDQGVNLYYQAQLSHSTFVELQVRLQGVARLPGLRPSYNMAPYITDLPQAKFYFQVEDGDVTSTVFGIRVSITQLSSEPGAVRPMNPSVPPEELLELHRFFMHFDVPGASKWTPPYIEVMVWPYEYAPEESIHWPQDWPGLESEMAVPWRDAYSIYLKGSQLPAHEDFLATQKEKGAVEIAGRKWAASWKPVFPSEPIWRRTFKGRKSSKQDNVGG